MKRRSSGDSFIDTSIWVAVSNTRDTNHPRALKLMRTLLKGENRIYTSDYVFDEAVTALMNRTRRPDKARELGDAILRVASEGSIEILRVDVELFGDAWAIFKKYEGRSLSFTDCTSVALMERRGIGVVASFDSGFDGVVKRLS